MARRAGIVICCLLVLTGCGSGEDTVTADAAPPDASMRADAATVTDCDPVTQNCPNASHKCTITEPGGVRQRSCIAATGDVSEGLPCVRSAAGFGNDTCAAGLFCSFIGGAPPPTGTRSCRRFCHADTGCPGGQRCAHLLDSTPADGFCGPTCTPFQPCANGLDCSELWQGMNGQTDVFLACRPPGTTAAGGSCTMDEDCVAGSICFEALGNPRCLPICDSTHPCATGSCTFTLFPNGGGICM